jgi:hypothetical protein
MSLFEIFKHATTFLFPVALTVLTGCESAPTATEQNFGSSVRNMIELQTAEPAEPALGMDGQKAEAVLESYRQDVAKPKEVNRDIIQINLGR